ncbi:tetratricopeptide repeat protein [Actinomadura graeca]|uniref:Tetratricopeptide repeat protein n=1 Tax=Actinomadura graeca TaxID=2750812 RepID=A0ABX8QX22_9ACTN|nr:tetratricopeptide repeat protein [Actinomadura graeca]QXJ23384.1 tetratricopeptide repeat protein [Actinomadura graeca]
MRNILLNGRGASGTPVVVVEGPPGIGKTTAALRCAEDILRSEPAEFPDGQLFVDLRGYSPDGGPSCPADVLEGFLVSLGVPAQEVPARMERRAALYRSLLASRRVLIILDNAASSDQVEPLLPGSSDSAVIITSRRRLGALTMRVNVERGELRPLSEDECVAVLRSAIGAERATSEAESVAVLAHLCGRLPLALRIVAERVAAHPHHPIGELADELAAERQRLDGLAIHDSVNVRSAFGWSYRALSEAEARTFRYLGMHRGPDASVEAVAALTGVPVLRTRRRLQKLHEFHLLEGVPGSRYRHHDLLRLFAAERVEADEPIADRIAAARRLSNWYVHTAMAGGRALAPFRLNPLVLPGVEPGTTPLRFGDDKAALRWYDTEAANFVAVTRLAVDHGLHETAWKLAVALFDYFRLLRRPGSIWLATTALALRAAKDIADRYAEGWVETSLAEGYRWLRRYERSRLHFEHALQVRREVGDRHGEAWALAGLGFLAVDQGHWEPARECACQAISIFTELGDHHGRASSMLTIADSCRGRRDHAEALAMLDEALAIFERIENHDGQGLALAKLAGVHTDHGRLELALTFLDRSVQARRIAGSRWGEADGLARQARTLEALGRADPARRSWEAALELYEELGDGRADDIRAHLEGRGPRAVAGTLSVPAW